VKKFSRSDALRTAPDFIGLDENYALFADAFGLSGGFTLNKA
jgi:hypothetical protein